MGRPEESGPSSQGFEGGVAGLGLVDLIQLQSRNRFSGCFRLQHGDKLGLLFFRDGEIVHAEHGSRSGVEAFCDIIDWPRGQFSVEANVVTARRTIQLRCEHLLLEAHRVLDERHKRQRDAPPPRPEPTPAPVGPRPAVETTRSVPGVANAVLLSRDGSPVVREGYEGDLLAGESAYLAAVGNELGALLQAGEFRAAAVQGTNRHLLILATKTQYLGVSLRPEAEVWAADAAIRSALTKGR
jgi:predicted regulator of Ras-like GTPase activity (Roadblock/LC7/MglB family)